MYHEKWDAATADSERAPDRVLSPSAPSDESAEAAVPSRSSHGNDPSATKGDRSGFVVSRALLSELVGAVDARCSRELLTGRVTP
jgi:hypothetical protein